MESKQIVPRWRLHELSGGRIYVMKPDVDCPFTKELIHRFLTALPLAIIINLHDPALRNPIPKIFETNSRALIPVAVDMKEADFPRVSDRQSILKQSLDKLIIAQSKALKQVLNFVQFSATLTDKSNRPFIV